MDERLEEISRLISERDKHVNKDGTIDSYPDYDEWALLINEEGHVDWLIEKVHELELKLSISNTKMNQFHWKKRRYKQALEFYANPQIWKEGKLITDNRYEMPLAYNDNGEKAQQALRGESE